MPYTAAYGFRFFCIIVCIYFFCPSRSPCSISLPFFCCCSFCCLLVSLFFFSLSLKKKKNLRRDLLCQFHRKRLKILDRTHSINDSRFECLCYYRYYYYYFSRWNFQTLKHEGHTQTITHTQLPTTSSLLLALVLSRCNVSIYLFRSVTFRKVLYVNVCGTRQLVPFFFIYLFIFPFHLLFPQIRVKKEERAEER